MKVTVFGATGGVGRLCVLYALDEGHEVTAFCRPESTSKLTHLLSGKQFNCVIGDVLDETMVERALVGNLY